MARYRKMHSFYLDPELSEVLTVLKEELGIPESEQVRRAVRQYARDGRACAPRSRVRA